MCKCCITYLGDKTQLNNFSIKQAAQLSGVSALSIRAWEGRYSVLHPDRTATNRRLYSDLDIEKLILLKKLTLRGHRIGNLARLSTQDLIELVEKSELRENEANVNKVGTISHDVKIITGCIEAIKKYDDKKLTMLLNAASVKYNQIQLVEKVIIPLIEQTGVYWRDGVLRISNEHFASAVITKFLNNLSDGFKIQETAPRIIIATPEGQYHETGALVAASLAASSGWKTTYLGASLPAEDIAAAVKQLRVMCVFLSIVYPDDNPAMNTELKKLREMVGEEVFIIVHGNSVSGYINILNQVGGYITMTPKEFIDLLQIIRKQINPNTGSIDE